MFASKVSLMKRRNLGNYEHKEASIEFALVEGDSLEDALANAESFIAQALGNVAPKREMVGKTKVTTNAKPEVTKEDVKEAVDSLEKKAPAKKAPAKKAPAKEAKPEVTKEEVTAALRAYAMAKKSKDMAVEVMKDVTKADKLDEVDPKLYGKLVKALAV